jgi:hypothetical protein
MSQCNVVFLHPAESNLGYFLAWFQCLQLPSVQSESPLAVIQLAPKSKVYSTMNRTVHISVRISEGSLYLWNLSFAHDCINPSVCYCLA